MGKRIKDLSRAETDGYLAVDNPTNGTGKMNTSVIFNNFAEKFNPLRTDSNPYVAGDLVTYGGELYACKNTHYGDWADADFEKKSFDKTFTYIVSNVTGSAPYNDLNTYPEGKLCIALGNYSGVANKPEDSRFAVFTFGMKAVGIKFQLISTETKKLYKRSYFNGWSDWVEIKDWSENCVKNKGLITSATSPYNDLNTFPINEIVTLIGKAGDVAHRPSNSQFTAVTMGGLTSTKVQVVSTSDSKIYMRCTWGGTTWSDWVEIKNPPAGVTIKGVITSLTSTSPYNDLNTFPINEICFCPSNYSGVAHKPEENGFTTVTMSGQSGTSIQVFASSSKKIYMRSSWGSSWGSWFEIKDWSENGISNKGLVTTATSPYNDLNTFPVNEIVTMTTAGENVSNRPETNTQFSVMTFGGLASTKTQICTMSSGRTYIRSKWGGATWREWVQIKKYDSSDFEQVNPILYFDNIICIGDSLTYSQVYTGESTSRQAKKTWPQMLAKLCGATQTTYAVAGDTAITSWARYKDELVEKDNALAIIYLGTNYGFTDTLSTDAPENADPSTWSDTNTGCLAKYCNKLNTLGYKIVLVKPWVTGGGADLATTKAVIDQVGTRFGCCVVESFRTLEEKYHAWPNLEGQNSVHYNDLGYSWFASCLCEKIAESSTLAKILP